MIELRTLGDCPGTQLLQCSTKVGSSDPFSWKNHNDSEIVVFIAITSIDETYYYNSMEYDIQWDIEVVPMGYESVYGKCENEDDAIINFGDTSQKTLQEC